MNLKFSRLQILRLNNRPLHQDTFPKKQPNTDISTIIADSPTAMVSRYLLNMSENHTPDTWPLLQLSHVFKGQKPFLFFV